MQNSVRNRGLPPSLATGSHPPTQESCRPPRPAVVCPPGGAEESAAGKIGTKGTETPVLLPLLPRIVPQGATQALASTALALRCRRGCIWRARRKEEEEGGKGYKKRQSVRKQGTPIPTQIPPYGSDEIGTLPRQPTASPPRAGKRRCATRAATTWQVILLLLLLLLHPTRPGKLDFLIARTWVF